tara:strand:+ start:568 stop:1479 length:912 start_codon:yes stop_codon:yes gene_type:complete
MSLTQLDPDFGGSNSLTPSASAAASDYIGRTTLLTEGIFRPLFLGDFFAGNQTIEFAPPDPVDSYANPVLYNGAGGLSFRVEVPTGWNILGWPFPFPQSFGETITKGLGVDSLNQTFDQGLIIAKDFQGNACLPQFSFDGIGTNLRPGEGYQIKADFPMTINFPLLGQNAAIVNAAVQQRQQLFHDAVQATSIDLVAGWNIIGFNRFNPVDTISAIVSSSMFKEFQGETITDEMIASKIAIFKANNGTVYLPEFGYNGIGDLQPGQGYQVKLTSAVPEFKFHEEVYAEQSLITDSVDYINYFS